MQWSITFNNIISCLNQFISAKQASISHIPLFIVQQQKYSINTVTFCKSKLPNFPYISNHSKVFLFTPYDDKSIPMINNYVKKIIFKIHCQSYQRCLDFQLAFAIGPLYSVISELPQFKWKVSYQSVSTPSCNITF